MQPNQQTPGATPSPFFGSLFSNVQQPNKNQEQKKTQIKGQSQGLFSSKAGSIFSFEAKSETKKQPGFNLAPASGTLFGADNQKSEFWNPSQPLFPRIENQTKNAFTIGKSEHGWLNEPFFGNKSSTGTGGIFASGSLFGKPKAQEGQKGKQTQPKQPSIFNNNAIGATPTLNINSSSSIFGPSKNFATAKSDEKLPTFGISEPKKQESKSNQVWGEKNQSTPEFKLTRQSEQIKNQETVREPEKSNVFGKEPAASQQPSLSASKTVKDKEDSENSKKNSLFSFLNPNEAASQQRKPKENENKAHETLTTPQLNQPAPKINLVSGGSLFGSNKIQQAPSKQNTEKKIAVEQKQIVKQTQQETFTQPLVSASPSLIRAPSPASQRVPSSPKNPQQDRGSKISLGVQKFNSFQSSLDENTNEPHGRERLATFDTKNDKSMFGTSKSQQTPKANEELFDLKKLSQVLCSGTQSQITQNSVKIEASLAQYLRICRQQSRDIIYEPVAFYRELKPEEGANKVINDFTVAIARLFNIPPSSYKVYGSLFICMIREVGYQDKFFDGLKLKESYFITTKMYNILNPNNMELMWDGDEAAAIISSFIKYISSLLLKCLKKLEGLHKLFKKTDLYDLLLETIVLVNFRYPPTSNPVIVEALGINDLRLVTQLNRILLLLLRSHSTSNQEIFSKKCVLNLIELADHLPLGLPAKLFQKVLLKQLNLDKSSRDPPSKDLISKLDKTSSAALLPFRVILYRFDRNRHKKERIMKDLLVHVDGPEWIDWLSVYLGEDNIKLNDKQIGYLIKSLKQMKIKDIDKIVNKESQINRFLQIMVQENQIKSFYEAISALVYDEDSIKKVEAQYFKNDSLHSDLRQLANQIRKFPNCEFNEEDMPQLLGKSLYLLTVLCIQPDRALEFENALFDIDGFIDDVSERCDRICNLVIDILAYFSTKHLDQEIVMKSFQAMTSLFSHHSTKNNMALALTVNRPQIDFLHKNISASVSKKIELFLTQLFSASQFYTSTRLVNQNDKVEKVYPFRYQISKYLILTEEISANIPLYWFSNCLKISTRQNYSPFLLEVMLSKLKIFPNSNKSTDIPFILSTIVEASNQANFWKELSSKIEASTILGSDRYFLQNKYLSQQSDSVALPIILGSLNLLKTIIELQKIRQRAQTQFPRHFITQLLSSLNCLDQLEREYIQLGSEPQLMHRKTVPPLISLLVLLSESSTLRNFRYEDKIEWVFDENRKLNYTALDRIKKEKQQFDYGILKDCLTHPYNEHLDCLENISSLSCYVLKELIPQTKDISFESLLYLCLPSGFNNSKSFDQYMKLRQESINNFKQCLTSTTSSVRRNSWNLLACLRNSPQNKKFAKDIFNKYCSARSQLVLHPSLVYLLEFIAAEARDHVYQSSEILIELMQKLESVSLNTIMDDIEAYGEQAQLMFNLHQYVRLFYEKNIIIKLHYLRMCDLLAEIVLREIYDNQPQATVHSALLIKIYVETQFIRAFSKTSAPSNLNQLICNPNIPRLYGKDVLELYISDPQKKAEDLIGIQVNNVRNWFYSRISQTMDKAHSYLSVILSINETYYANHPIKLSSFKKSEIFCEHHLELRKYRWYEFFSSQEREAVTQARLLLNFLIRKMELMKKENLRIEILKMQSLFDLFLGWLHNCQDLKKGKGELISEYKSVLSVCFNQLEEPIVDPLSAKLLLSCVKTISSQIQDDMGRKIRQAIVKTINSGYSISPDIKQELLSLFIILPPTKDESNILELVAKMWFIEENNQYFYNESRVIYKLCQIYPFEMAQLKILSKCQRILKFEDSTLQGVRYRQNLRTNEAKNWLWILKIASVLLENGMKSTLVVHQISRFLENNKKRLIYTFNECRQDLNLKKQRQICIKVNLAQLDELEASLEFFVILAQSKMWIEMNRQAFEEILYYLMHRTIVLFAPTSVGQKLRKKYIPQSRNEKIMWDLQAGENLLRQQAANISEGYDPDRIEEEYATQLNEYNAERPSVFILAMSLKYNQCLKLWLLGCSFGMRSSCFVREYFNRPIMLDARGNSLKYSLTHWEHLNKALSQIMQGLTVRVREWGKWHAKGELVHILNDCFNSAQFFTEAGYIYSLSSLPQNQEELISELGQSLAFALEMGTCHLVSQIYFKNKAGTFWKENIQGFQEKLLKLSALGEQKLIQNKISRQDSILEQLKVNKQLLSQVKYC